MNNLSPTDTQGWGVTDTQNYTLSIGLCPDGFCFSLHAPIQQGTYFYHQERFDSGSSYLAALENAVYAHPRLLENYRKVYICIENERFTLVPTTTTPLTLTQQQAYYRLAYNRPSDVVQVNLLPRAGAELLFGIDKELYDFANRTFAAPCYLHQLSPLIEYAIHRKETTENYQTLLQLRPGALDVVVTQRQELRFAHTLEVRHLNDAAYYLLNMWQQLKLSQQHDSLYVAGDHSQREPFLLLVAPYIEQIHRLEIPAELDIIGSKHSEEPLHLKLLPLCEL